jgi:hypothetical protein
LCRKRASTLSSASLRERRAVAGAVLSLMLEGPAESLVSEWK